MNKKVVVFGGGTGMSFLLRGLKEYPLDLTAVVSVCDDGGSTGILRDELNISAVGDLRKVLVSLSRSEDSFEKLLNYRFVTNGSLNKHTVGNILLAAQTEISGSLQKSIETLSEVLNLKGKVMPFTEDNITLNGEMEDGSIVNGEHFITESPKKVKRVFYDSEPSIANDLIKEITSADIIVLSMGSLFTSVIPNLLSEKIRNAIDNSKASIVYACNLFTQPGETDDFKVSDHVRILNDYLGKKKINYVIANNGVLKPEITEKYATLEQKDPVILDSENVAKMGVKIVSDDFALIDVYNKQKVIRHNYLKLGFYINTIALGYYSLFERN